MFGAKAGSDQWEGKINGGTARGRPSEDNRDLSSRWGSFFSLDGLTYR
jgi:hypothetical protein